jgi:hypothetical protein
VPYIYKDHLDTALKKVGGSAALDKIGNIHAAVAMADTLFREGEGDGGNIIRNAVIRTDPRLKDALRHEPGTVKEKTFEAYSRLAKNPATLGALLDNVAQERTAAATMKAREAGKAVLPGDLSRFEYFRFKNKR